MSEQLLTREDVPFMRRWIAEHLLQVAGVCRQELRPKRNPSDMSCVFFVLEITCSARVNSVAYPLIFKGGSRGPSLTILQVVTLDVLAYRPQLF